MLRQRNSLSPVVRKFRYVRHKGLETHPCSIHLAWSIQDAGIALRLTGDLMVQHERHIQVDCRGTYRALDWQFKAGLRRCRSASLRWIDVLFDLMLTNLALSMKVCSAGA